jgi:hypothetical protein
MGGWDAEAGQIESARGVFRERWARKPASEGSRVDSDPGRFALRIQDERIGIAVDGDVEVVGAVEGDGADDAKPDERCMPDSGGRKAVDAAVGRVSDVDSAAAIEGDGVRFPRERCG